MNRIQFIKKLGVTPIQDDLQRVNCKTAGLVGHWHCGWCLEHDKPRFMCMCRAPLPNKACSRRVQRRGAKVVKSKSKVMVGRTRG